MFERLIQKLEPQSKLLRIWELKGGISAQVTALEVERPDGQIRKMVLRQHGEIDFKNNPKIAADEFKLLQVLQAAGVAAPKPYYVDDEIFNTPCIVIEYIEGETDFAPANLTGYISQFAAALSHIHAVDCADLSFLPQHRYSERPEKLDDSLNEGRIRDALDAVWPLPQRNPQTLLHGDFWPGNCLWRNGQLVAVIDWEDAQLGDPLSDLANARLETLWAFGIDAMLTFTQRYLSLTSLDLTDLPYWDLCAALEPASRLGDWGLDDITEKRMREQHHWFVNQALDD